MYTDEELYRINEFHRKYGDCMVCHNLPDPDSKTEEESIKYIQDALKSYVPKEKLI